MPLAEARFRVPALVERPAVGTSCCVTPAEALIAQELFLLGAEDVDVDPATGQVTVRFDPSRLSLADAASALAEIGYPPAPRD
jgi:hypothetical protein